MCELDFNRLRKFFFLGRHVTCQIESKEDSSTSNSSLEINVDGVFINGDHQSLMRAHPLHVKVNLILSRNYLYLKFFLLLTHLFSSSNSSSWSHRGIIIHISTAIEYRYCRSKTIGATRATKVRKRRLYLTGNNRNDFSQTLTSTLLHNLLDDNDNGQLSPNPTTDFLFQQYGSVQIWKWINSFLLDSFF